MAAACASAKLLAASLLPSPTPNNLRRPFRSPNRLLRRLASSTAAAGARESAAANPLFQTLSAAQKDQISLYVRALLRWNQRMNLTAVKEEGEAMTRHVEDSLAMLPPIRRSHAACSSLPPFDDLRVIDVGTGAGVPGLVLAVACPGWKVTLLESMNKRCLFLEHVVDVMGLSNVQILCGRAESVGHELEFREAFHISTARAVAEMRVLVEYCLPFVRVGGLFIAAKGHDPQVEVKTAEIAIRLMGASMVDICTDGYVMPSWFDIPEIPIAAESPKDEHGLLKAVETVHAMIDREIAAGMNPDNVFICGFSQGGALALASVLLYPKTLGGGAVFSGWLPFNHSIVERITPEAKRTPIYWSHGIADNVVLFGAGQAGPPFLRQAGINCEFKAYPGLGHSISNEELHNLESWIKARLKAAS